MKTVFIPKGETVHYEKLTTDHLVVQGYLEVDNDVRAKTISGSGFIRAGAISADTICLDELETSYTVCRKLICKRAESAELFASESAAVSCFLSAAYVETGKLTVAASQIDEVRADEVVNLPLKKRGLLGTLLASAVRSLWTKWTVSAEHSQVQDASYTQVPDEETAEASVVPEAEAVAHQSETSPQQENMAPAEVDEELNRFVNMFKLLRETGYTLRIIPGTPEENAPVFDFGQEQIIRKAA